MQCEIRVTDRMGGLVVGLLVCCGLAACHNNAANEGISCGTTTCTPGQVCCIDCDGQGQCHSPGAVCVGLACQAQNSDAGHGADATTTGQVCCIDCDGKRTCGDPPFACPGHACLAQDGGERCGTVTCEPGSRCCEHCGTPFCHDESTCPASAEPCTIDLCATFAGCVTLCQGGDCECRCKGCFAMDTVPVKPSQCEIQSRYTWDGKNCVEFDACGCTGEDCASLFKTVDQCLRAFAHCGATEATTLPCGPSACNAQRSYCLGIIPGTPGGEGETRCVELPQACLDMADPDCSCFNFPPGPERPDCKEHPADAFTVNYAMP